MSYHLAQEKETKSAEAKKIEMPPLPAEAPVDVNLSQQEVDSNLTQDSSQALAALNQPEQTEAADSTEQKPSENPFAYNDQQVNLRNLREAKERAERERDEAIRILREAAQRQQPQQEEDSEPNLAPDDIVEWKHVDRKMKKLEGELKRYQQQTYEMTVEAKLKAENSDFDHVVTKENIASLRAKHPQIAQSLDYNPDLYSKASSAYLLIKQLGIVQDPVQQIDRDRAVKNMAKPRPSISAAPQQGGSPLEQANAFASGLTDELSKKLHREMLEAIKNR